MYTHNLFFKLLLSFCLLPSNPGSTVFPCSSLSPLFSHLSPLLLLQAYSEKKAMVIEEVDTPETYDAAFTVVNKVCRNRKIFVTLCSMFVLQLGSNCPVTVKPAHTLKVCTSCDSHMIHQVVSHDCRCTEPTLQSCDRVTPPSHSTRQRVWSR